jgi:hypothetical protein
MLLAQLAQPDAEVSKAAWTTFLNYGAIGAMLIIVLGFCLMVAIAGFFGVKKFIGRIIDEHAPRLVETAVSTLRTISDNNTKLVDINEKQFASSEAARTAATEAKVLLAKNHDGAAYHLSEHVFSSTRVERAIIKLCDLWERRLSIDPAARLEITKEDIQEVRASVERDHHR